MNYSDETADEFSRLQDRIDHENLWELDRQLEIAMDALRLPPAGRRRHRRSPAARRRRVALCQILLRKPDMLLLDEPTNHLDAESVAWLERHLAEYKGTVVAVTHDRYFLDNVAGWILELDRGAGIPWEGNYSSWLAQKDAAARPGGEGVLHPPPDARSTSSSGSSSRPAPATPRARRASTTTRSCSPRSRRRSRAEIPTRSTSRPARVWAIWSSKRSRSRRRYGDNVLIDKLSFILPRGGIVGVIGPNGAGKTTLFRMIVGQEKPDSGELRIGETVALAYVDQSRETLSATNTLWEEISDGGKDLILIGKKEVNSRAYCAAFNFRGADQQKKVRDLSGGERNRLHLAKILKSGGNLLLLDEPTNDLDVDTLRALEDALLEFAGCAVVISHDRWFLDRIATHILAFEGDSEVVWFEGNYQDYEADRKRRLGTDADQPHRLKYRKLVH